MFNPIEKEEPVLKKSSMTVSSIAKELKNLKELLDSGVITRHEFEEQKKEVIENMTDIKNNF